MGAIDLDASIPATWIFVAGNVGVHLGTAAVRVANAHGGVWEALLYVRPLRFRVAWGGQLDTLVADGQVWRLFTAPWLHHGALHLVLNVIGIWSIGRLLEPWVGGLRLLSWGLAAGVAGSWASHLVGIRYTDGASGVAFGLLGAAVILGRRRVAEADTEGPWWQQERWWLGRGLAGLLAVSLGSAIMLPFLNVVAHAAGAAVGLGVAAGYRGPMRAVTALHAAWVAVNFGVLTWAFLVRG